MVKNKYVTLYYFRGLLCLVVMLAVTACGGLPTKGYLAAKKEAAKARPAYQKFQELCLGEGLPSLDRSLKIRGYLMASTYGLNCDFNGWDSIVKGRLDFFECTEEKIMNYSDLQRGAIYRFELINKRGQCPEYEFVADKYIEKYSDMISEGYCLIKKKFDKPASKYARLSEWGRVNEEGDTTLDPGDKPVDAVFGFSGWSIIDIKSGQLLSVLNRKYIYTPYKEQNYIQFTCKYEGPDEFNDLIIVN